MFRVDAIATRPGAAPGSTVVGNDQLKLSEFDLIVIVGPNGSGKSRLTECLADPDKTLKVTSPEGESFNPKDHVFKGLLSASSETLQLGFKDLSDALASCAGVVRLNGEIEVLKRLIPDGKRPGKDALDSLLAADAAETPHNVRNALDALEDAERAADGAVDSVHRYDLASYNDIGVAVAALTGKAWQPVDEHPDVAVMRQHMEQAERAVAPQTRLREGQQDLTAALTDAVAWGNGIAANTAAKNALVQAQRAMQDAASKARDLLMETAAADAAAVDAAEAPGLRGHLATLRESLQNQSTQKQELIKALDALADVRSRAREYLAQCDDSACPVCRSAVDRASLIEQLASEATTEDPRLQEAKTALADIRDRLLRVDTCIKGLDAAVREEGSALEDASRQIKGWRDALRTIRDRLVPQMHWDAGVRQVATEASDQATHLHGRTEWSAAPCAAQLDTLVDAAKLFATDCQRRKQQLEASAAELNRGINDASRYFNQLQPLRALLLAQRALNALHWEPRWQAQIAERAKQETIDRWKRAVARMVSERQNRLNQVQNEILGDTALVDRFSRLLRVTRHPLLTQPRLVGSAVHAGDPAIAGTAVIAAKGQSSQLSEGYTVMVNLAALIAVTGYVRDGQQHRAGWLLLDEPTNGLDDTNRSHVANYLGSLTCADMPRQLFVATFDTEFADQLLARARETGQRRALKVTLPPWNGQYPNQPQCIPYTPNPA